MKQALRGVLTISGVRSQVEAEYQETFGLGDIVAKRRTSVELSGAKETLTLEASPNRFD